MPKLILLLISSLFFLVTFGETLFPKEIDEASKKLLEIESKKKETERKNLQKEKKASRKNSNSNEPANYVETKSKKMHSKNMNCASARSCVENCVQRYQMIPFNYNFIGIPLLPNSYFTAPQNLNFSTLPGAGVFADPRAMRNLECQKDCERSAACEIYPVDEKNDLESIRRKLEIR